MLINLDYQINMQDIYQNLSHLPGFVLLESTDRTLGRYDILCAYPYDRVVISENTPNIFDALEKAKQKLKIIPSDLDLPFQGGAIGFISYDFGARLHGIHSVSQQNLFDMPLVDLGFYDWAVLVDHHLETACLFAACLHPDTESIIKEIIDLWNLPRSTDILFDSISNFSPLNSFDEYEASFRAIYHSLQEGRCYQVNLTQPFIAPYEGDAWHMYKKVSSMNPVPFSSFLRYPKADILSFSPERFLLKDSNTLLTSPIKGTIARSTDVHEDELLKAELRSSEKDFSENVMIVDLLRNDLGKVAKPGTVNVLKLCSIQSFNSVHHLVSDIEAVCMDDLHPLDLFISCFPGGSITGAPKLESMRVIHEQERYGRGIYCGSIGYFSRHGRFDTNVAIRTVTAKDKLLHLAAGGGIVIDSICSKEYKECYTKIAAIINSLQS